MDAETVTRRPKFRKVAVFIFWLSVVACLFLSVVHFLQPDQLAPVTLVPPWIWLLPGLMAIAIARKSVSKWALLISAVMWFGFAAMFVEEAASLLRFRSPVFADVRIITLNCCLGSKAASLEPAGLKPDVVFFQESQGPAPTQALAEEYFGSEAFSVHGGDVSIISRLRLVPVHVDPKSHFVHVVASFEDGRKMDLVCLRLAAPVFRMDFWSAGFWNDHQKVRQHHRAQLETVIAHLNANAQTESWIIGGDFNLVGNDGALSAFEDLQDTFAVAGSGWCNTGTSDFPLFRVDQIWTTRNVQCHSQKVYASENSDHRMVVVDLDF